MSETKLTFTGERFLPSCEREIWYEHYHRYAMALQWVEGLDVLDAACGEGYGSELLATKAKSVTGVDISEKTITHAQHKYQKENLKFVTANVIKLPFKDNAFDVVVSFETLEHLIEHEELIKEFKRVLKTTGLLIISTPDKKEYSDKTGFDNEYHLKELYQPEFKGLLESQFKFSLWYGQKLMFSSMIWGLGSSLNSMSFSSMHEDGSLSSIPTFNPVYFIAIAGNQNIVQKNKVDCYGFSEHAESVYGHYNAVIRAHIKAEKDCIELQQQQNKWLQHPIIGRCIKWFGKE